MSIRKRFNEIFGIEDNIEEEKRRFVERVNQFIFHDIDTSRTRTFNYERLFEFVCFELGINAHDFPRRRMGDILNEYYIPASVRNLTGDDFDKTLLVLSSLYLHIEHYGDSEKGQRWLSTVIKISLSRCTCDIGVRWKDGFFYPSGAEELDKPLIEEMMTWLKDYPNENKDYQAALKYYGEGKNLSDVIENCYTAVEGVVRNVLGNIKTLDNNKDELLTKVKLSDGWKPILANYIKYAHDYRHASTERHDIEPREAEAYLYMTGLIIRLIIESK